MKDLISVIVPVYNAEAYLPVCIESIQEQVYENLEIILIDDGSTDSSLSICEKYAEIDSRIMVISQENKGTTHARNTGIMASHGKYIGFVDSDDWIERNMYERLYEECVMHNADVAVCQFFVVTEEYSYKKECAVPSGIYCNSGDSKISRNLIYMENTHEKGMSQHLWDKLISKELLIKYQLQVDERTKYAEDDVAIYACLINADKVVVLDDVLYHYRQRRNSLCHSHDENYFAYITLAYKQMKNFFEVHKDSAILLPQLKMYMLELVLWGINDIFGFEDTSIIPSFIPPMQRLKNDGVTKIVIYGAGKVGKDYWNILNKFSNMEIVAWVDKKGDCYREAGLPVSNVESLDGLIFDRLLIAVESRATAQLICDDLVVLGIEPDKIIYEKPESFIGKMIC